ncbi:gluconolaconase [Salmonirosea aquatica]|uniref:Gluconolaconase n=1 Tax=Salmonirosea aquatica TaxID=2654236 RepID=A0A7C9B950_9BACT|nr:gluconolaconase [Cytophagaceae bacterium SJW1-29]
MKTNLLPGALLMAAVCGLSACEDHRLSPNADFPERIEFFAERQYPEGMAYSARLDRFIITSLTQGKVGTVSTDGQYADLVSDPALISGVGVKVADERIFVANSDNGVSSKSSPATTQKTAELLVFNLNSRTLERRVDLDDLLPGMNHFANDIALNPDGTVYVTDSFSPVIYKVTSEGTPSILVRDDVLFSSPTFGLNGIVYHPDGFLIVANTGVGKLFKVDLKNGNAITEVGGLGNLPGDGMTLVGTTDLYVVTGSGSRVALVRSNDNFATASVVETQTDGYSMATTSTYVNGQIFTINARIGEINAAMGDASKLQSNTYSIQRYK